MKFKYKDKVKIIGEGFYRTHSGEILNTWVEEFGRFNKTFFRKYYVRLDDGCEVRLQETEMELV